MSYRYIALSVAVAGNLEDFERSVADSLRSLAMDCRGHVGCVALYAPQEAPAFDLPGGGILLGDLYDEVGRPVRDLAGLRHLPTQAAIRQHVLDHYWGEYLLFQPSDDGGTTVLRDPSGGVDCAYSLRGGNGFITSDLAIASRLGLHRDRIDWDFVRHCLLYPHIKIARTGLAGISELLPGCMLSVEGQKSSTGLGWSPWHFVTPAERQSDPVAAAQTIRDATTSVVRAMAETDRSLLLELSGGLDSSIVGACLANARTRMACCTAITPLPGADERRYASQIARQLGTKLLEQMLDFAEADIDFRLPRHSLRPAAWALGRAVARAMDNAAELQRVNSLFSGGGGDTVFCYLKSAAPAADAFRARGLTAGYRAIVDLSRLHGCTVAKAARLALRKLYRTPKGPCKPDGQWLLRTGVALPLEMHPWFSAPPHVLPGDRERIFELAGTQLFRDSTLRSGGRRVRFPLLSQPVMEACLRVPSWLWISGGQNRSIARSAFSGQLPHEVLNRRSKGTFMNYTFAVYRKNKATIGHFLLDGHLRSQGLLDPRELSLFLESPLPARDRSFMRIFDLCMIENWVRNHA
ncbi:asparagine synthase C-terminal domain-containing protein [Frateuria terrea]|uniref:asparagine synthase (glutamine-hydrolyzing) n=1 Tax=Frateuria terrea TaxID=529704 RepID=A0A1H6VFS3_9GAMM|nr:asparagine synthase C-terminal domain-containing protein [Frateuria terrea]SEJ00627.1 asparagine synthase (glutamine-hydrolysing) [Frateuria terrea]SFP65520.1 asparagine synthase (glutamine-hydrolysing) [Frateuria terrea]